MKILGFILSVVALAKTSHIAESLSYGTPVESRKTDENEFRRPSIDVRASASPSAINSAAYSYNLASDEERRSEESSVPAAIFSPETPVTRSEYNLKFEQSLLPATSGSRFTFHSDNAISRFSALNSIPATEHHLNLLDRGEPHSIQKLPSPFIGSGYKVSHSSEDEIRQSVSFESSSSSNALSSYNIGIPVKIEHLQFQELPSPIIGSGYSFSYGSGGEIKQFATFESSSSSHATSGSNVGLSVNKEHLQFHELPSPIVGSGYSFSYGSGGEIKQFATFESSSSSHATSGSNVGLSVNKEHLQFQELPSPIVGSGYSFSYGSGGEIKQSANFESSSSSHATSGSKLGLSVNKEHLQFQELPSPIVGSGYSFSYGSGGEIKQSANFESSSSSHATSGSKLGLSVNKEHLQFQELPSPIVGSGYSFSYGSSGEIKQFATFESSSSSHATSGSNVGLSVNKEHLQFQELPSPIFGSGYSFSYGSGGEIKQSANFESSSSSHATSGSKLGLSVNKEHLQFQELPSPIVGSGYSFSYGSGGEIKQSANFESSSSSHATSGSKVGLSVNEAYLKVQELPSPLAGSNSFSYGSGSKIQIHSLSIESESSKFGTHSGFKIDSNSEITDRFQDVSSLRSQERQSALIPSTIPVDSFSPGGGSGFSFSYGTPGSEASRFQSSSGSHIEVLSPSQFPDSISYQSAAVIDLSSISSVGSNNNNFLPSKPSIDFSINPIIVAPYPASEKT